MGVDEPSPQVATPSAPASEREAWLWSTPENPVVESPTAAEPESLPLHGLSYRDAERLFLRLLEVTCDVTYAKSFGLPGQAQDGIDVYGRIRASSSLAKGPPSSTVPDGAESHGLWLDSAPPGRSPEIPGAVGARESRALTSRRYVALQSKRVEKMYPSSIEAAVTKFLEGGWSKTAKQFYLATTFDFRERDLDQAVRVASTRLEAVGVEFVPWDSERVNELLRDQPRLVERFFGREWVGPFCGHHNLALLGPRHLDGQEVHKLRQGLGALYRASFAAVASLRPTKPDEISSFVMLDVVGQVSSEESWAPTGDPSADPQTTAVDREASDHTDPHLESHHKRTGLSRTRRPMRSVRSLLSSPGGRVPASGSVPADQWAAAGDRNLLIGGPGAGKSSVLRFVATDLLAKDPSSVHLQRQFGGNLPVWLPFSYLCHHLDADHANSLTSAIAGWLTSQGRTDLIPLAEKALRDERLLLLIDGIDEWTSESTANTALGHIETFLGQSQAAALLSSRPYAISRLPFNLAWRRADLAPLNESQQLLIAEQYLVRAPADAVASGDAGWYLDDSDREAWSRTNVRPFLAQLAGVHELQSFASTPLLLALLANSWRGEPLPPRRFDLLRLIVRMLVDTHPKMRARASQVTVHSLDIDDFLVALQAVAYRIRTQDLPQPMPVRSMSKLLQDAFADESLLDFDEPTARSMAMAALTMAEDEFGLVVPQGARHVSFVHRVIGDHLAGCHVAELESEAQHQIFEERFDDAAWTDILLAALNAQTSRHQVASLLDEVLTSGRVESADNAANQEPTTEWPYAQARRHAALRFVGEACAADAKLAPPASKRLLDLLIREVEQSPFLELRDHLVTSLARASASNWRHLEQTLRRWLDATRHEPAAAMWTLKELPSTYEERADTLLLSGLSHAAESVKSAALETYAARYGRRDGEFGGHKKHIAPLIERMTRAPDSSTQSAALLALIIGWPNDPVTREALTWARQAPKTNLRTAALYGVAAARTDVRLSEIFSADEYQFTMNYLYDERYFDDHPWTKLNSDLVMRAVMECDEAERVELAAFALETLRQTPLTGGRRSLCWDLACGPLAGDLSLRQWVIEELSDTSDKYPLTLYSLSSMPSTWTDDPAMKEAIHRRSDVLLDSVRGGNVTLTRALPHDQARDALLAALDGFRPAVYAQELIERFGDDPTVRTTLDERLADDSQAPNFASIAIAHLGARRGFERIFSLLKAHNQTNPSSASQEHERLALAVAYGWCSLRKAAVTDNEPAKSEAIEVLAEYPESEVAAAGMAVPTNGFGWHVADVIYAWPNFAVDYTLRELRSGEHVTTSSSDHIHSTAIRAHIERPGPRSDEVVDLALDLMTPLPAALREVLAFALATAPLPPETLLTVTSTWPSDPDDQVRTVTAVGVTQALLRTWNTEDHRQREPFRQWRTLIRDKLVALGPTYEADRQIAWICMLLLQEPSLLDELSETFGDRRSSDVKLTDLDGQADEVLVDLIGQHWTELGQHLGPHPLRRLAKGNDEQSADELPVLSALTRTAHKSPAIAALLRERLDQEPPDGPTRRLLETTTDGIDYLIAEEGRTSANLQRVLEVSDGKNGVNTAAIRERWMLSHLLEPWDLTLDQVEQRLVVCSELDRPPGRRSAWEMSHGAVARAALAVLNPASEHVRAQLKQLSDWFNLPSEGRPTQGPGLTWLEATAVTFMAAPPTQLPLLIQRILDPRRLEVANEPWWKFTTPILRRIRVDDDAAAALASALNGEEIAATSLFELEPLPDDVARRVFLSTCVLRVSGRLEAAQFNTALGSLRSTDPRTTVVNPFSGDIGPLHVLGAKLVDA
jgi:hypothetical protein